MGASRTPVSLSKYFPASSNRLFLKHSHNCIKLLLKLFKKSYKQVTNTNKKLMPLTIITLAETSFVLRSLTEPECSLFLAAIPNGSSALCILQTSASRQWLLYEKIDRYKILGLENNRFICFSNNQGVKLLSMHPPIVYNDGVLIQPVIHTDLQVHCLSLHPHRDINGISNGLNGDLG